MPTRESQHYADIMCTAANRIGLNLHYVNPTAMDGNCFYHAVIEQIHRREILPLIDPNLHFTDHLLLRTVVSSFVMQNEFNLDLIREFKYLNNITENQWQQILLQQGTTGTYADEIFCRCSAIMLNVQIYIMTLRSTENATYYPLNYYGPTSGVIFIIANITDFHFQSLIPKAEDVIDFQI